MSALTADQVRHIARLARLRLTDAQVEQFTTELSSILDYIDVLPEVDTENVEATAQVTGLHNAFREDKVQDCDIPREDLLGCSPLPIVDHQIQTPSAHG